MQLRANISALDLIVEALYAFVVLDAQNGNRRKFFYADVGATEKPKC